jgi:hypothetical protein
VQTLGRCGRDAAFRQNKSLLDSASKITELRSTAQRIQLSPNRETKARVIRSKPSQFKPLPIKPRREDHYTPEKFRMECVWENLLRR